MADLYNVIFRGDILPGQSLPEVKARVAQLFKLDDARLAAVFSGKPVVLKKDCDQAMAEKIRAALAKAGADSEVKPATAAVAAPASKPAAPAPVAAKPLTPAPSPAAPAAAGGLKVAPVGMVMTEVERAALRKPPVQVKTDHLSLEKRASSFASADEKKSLPVRPEIKAPDFGVAAAGADLLKPEEKRVFEELDLDLSGIAMAELGADMLPEDQKVPLPVMEIEELNVDLAPVGSDMGEIKKGPPPPPPKTDHLKLV